MLITCDEGHRTWRTAASQWAESMCVLLTYFQIYDGCLVAVCLFCHSSFFPPQIPMSSPSQVGDVTVDVFDIIINQPSLPTPSLYGFSTVFHAINFPSNSRLSHSALQVLFLHYWSFQLYYLFIKVSFSPSVILFG